ncbi:MAG: FAD:protein FMN transferase, partial [Longimicrobiales bacterium]|nr:FAD:protein FMN transferase [Longimicrobiales bacterium]
MRRPLLLTGLVLAPVALVLALAGFVSDDAWVERIGYRMGTSLGIRLNAPTREAGLEAIEAAFERVARLEGVLSTWRDDTDLARLNRIPVGHAVRLAPELRGILTEALGWSGRTEGAFDPRVGALVDAWDLRGEGRVPELRGLERAVKASGPDAFQLDGDRAIRLREGAWIDAGSFGKGAALRDAHRALVELGVTDALLDFGGQILAMGAGGAGADGWTVPVAHPSRRDETAATLRLRDRSAATSGSSERFVTVDGVRYGHLLDPRSGRPVEAWGSVTVIASDPFVADVLSTALFVVGP